MLAPLDSLLSNSRGLFHGYVFGSWLELDGDYLSLSVQLIPRGELMLVPLDSLPSHSGVNPCFLGSWLRMG